MRSASVGPLVVLAVVALAVLPGSAGGLGPLPPPAPVHAGALTYTCFGWFLGCLEPIEVVVGTPTPCSTSPVLRPNTFVARVGPGLLFTPTEELLGGEGEHAVVRGTMVGAFCHFPGVHTEWLVGVGVFKAD